MNRNHLMLAGVGLLSLLGGIVLFQLIFPDSTSLEGSAPTAKIELHSIPLTELDGKATVLSDWNSKILVVNFWAPWCAPCRREIPALLAIQASYDPSVVRILGVAFDGEQQVRLFAEEYGIDYPLFLAGNRSPMYNAAFVNPSGSLPYTALLGPERNIVFQHNGELTEAQLREQIEALL